MDATMAAGRTAPGQIPCRLDDVLQIEGLTLLGEPSSEVMARPVRWVQVTELVDPEPYLRPDELVCTVGTTLQSPHACGAFVDVLVRGGAAGLCFGVGDVCPEVPEALVEACHQRSLPLVVAPLGLPFLLISDLVTERRIAHEGSAPRPARQRERVGQLLTLVGDRLAAPEALRSSFLEAGMDPDRLAVGAWPAGTGDSLPADGWVVGESPTATFGVCSDVAVLREIAGQLGLPCGISETSALASLARTVNSARAALLLGARSGQVVGPDELASLDGLLEQQPPDRLSPFLDHVLAPLRSSDKDGTLESTLRTFIAENRSVERTARAVYVHANTVRHRLARVQATTGRDPFDLEDLVTLRIALWAAEQRR